MGRPIMIIVSSKYQCSLWLFDYKEFQITILDTNTKDFVETLKCNNIELILYVLVEWLEEQGEDTTKIKFHFDGNSRPI